MGTGRSGRNVPERPLSDRSSGDRRSFCRRAGFSVFGSAWHNGRWPDERAGKRAPRSIRGEPAQAAEPTRGIALLLGQFKSPIIILLLCAAGLSLYLHNTIDAVIILAIVLVSGLLGFWQERGAAHCRREWLLVVQTKASVRRDGKAQAGGGGGCRPRRCGRAGRRRDDPRRLLILESRDLNVDEAALTGETYPVEKSVGVLPATALLGAGHACSWGRTSLAAAPTPGHPHRRDTEFGQVSQRLQLSPTETEFERGMRRFGYLLVEVTGVLVITIFAVNAYLGKPVLDSFLFSLALAVGLTPQLLPAIISVNLAHGARRMAQSKVIVKRLTSIENFGSMNVLCSDKTGTLTEGKVGSQPRWMREARARETVLLHAYLNATFESGFANPIDDAIRRQPRMRA